jgi:hypothetical protein
MRCAKRLQAFSREPHAARGHVVVALIDDNAGFPAVFLPSRWVRRLRHAQGRVAILRRAFHAEGVPMIGTAFGIGTPLGYPTQQFNPYGSFSGTQGTLAAQTPSITQAQVVQLLQQVLQQQYVQHQQLQQLLHAIPVQLAQLQQLIQFVPHQIQQLQQSAPFQQPFSQIAGSTGYGISTPWGVAPQTIGAQPSHVM